MKKGLVFTVIVSLLFLTSCEAVDEEKFVLGGRVENTGELKHLILSEGNENIDSIQLDTNNEFYFEGKAPQATLYTLLVGQRPYMLVLEDGEQVEFIADFNEPDNYSVTGSEISSKMKKLDALRAPFQEQQANLQREFQQRMSSGEEMSVVQGELLAKNDSINRKLAEPVLQFAQENKDNLAGFYGMLILYSVDQTGQEQAVIEYVENIQNVFPKNHDVQSFANHIEEIKPLSIGQQAPDFSSLTPEGDEVSLSDFRGQYVLLDFWAAWCAPCRDENPNIVAQYHAFKDRGFTVLGVSLDRDREAWLKAIDDDKLEWTQLSDLKMWQSDAGRLYNISAIPASFMIGPDGKIVGKNLRGPALKQFLESTL